MSELTQQALIPYDATQEAVALSLLNLIARAEGKIFDKDQAEGELVDRKWILNTYAECLLTVKSPVHR